MRAAAARAAAAALLVAAGGRGAAARTFCVDPRRGSDAANGTCAAPFATVAAAQAAVRAHLRAARGGGGETTVYLRGGTYLEFARNDRDWALTQEDSGAPGAPVRWASYPGDPRARITGAVPVTFTSPDAAELPDAIPEAVRANVVTANLKAQGVTDYGEITVRGGYDKGCGTSPMELMFDGATMNLCQHPNIGEYTRTTSGSGTKTFGYDSDQPFGGWKHTEDLWVHGYWMWEWNDRWQKVASVSSSTIKAAASLTGDGDISAGNRFILLNSLDALDQKGEYYIDRSNGVLYFIPPRALKSGDQGWLSVKKGALKSISASHVTVDGIDFDGGRGEAVSVSGDGVTITRCTIVGMGNGGIVADGSNIHIVNNLVAHVGGAGISISGGSHEKLTRSNNVVSDNYVHDFQRNCFTYSPGVSVDGCGHTISHNEVYNGKHTGFEIGGNDVLWEYNKVHDVIQECYDCGAFYWAPNDWSMWNTTFRYNFVYDSGTNNMLCNDQTSCVRACIYCDDGNGGENIHDNLFYMPKPKKYPSKGKGIASPSDYHLMAVFNDGGRNMKVENNMMVDPAVAACGNCASCNDNPKDWLEGLKDVHWQDPPYSKHYPDLAKLDGKCGSGCTDNPNCPCAPFGMTYINNVAVNCGGGESECDTGGCFAYPNSHMKKAGWTTKNNVETDDPGFAASDPRGSLDFSLRADSPVVKGGFRPLPGPSKYGPRSPSPAPPGPGPAPPAPPTPPAPAPTPPPGPTPPAPATRYHCDKSTYTCAAASSGHSTMALCEADCAAPPPAPPPGRCSSWSEKKSSSCDGDQIGSTTSGLSVAECEAKCAANAKCGCVSIKRSDASCELDKGTSASADPSGYDAYVCQE